MTSESAKQQVVDQSTGERVGGYCVPAEGNWAAAGTDQTAADASHWPPCCRYVWGSAPEPPLGALFWFKQLQYG
jgi:hypothetical protein